MSLAQSQKRISPSFSENKKLQQKFRKIGMNFSTRIMGNVVNKLIGLVTIPIIARALGPESYGQFSLIMVILSYTALIGDFGFSTYGIRESAKQQNSQGITSQIFSARLTLVLAATLVSTLVVFVIFMGKLNFILIVYIGYIWVIAQGINMDFYYFGIGNMLIPTSSQISGQALYALAVILFIKQSTHLALLILFYSLYYLWASSLEIFLYLKKNQTIAVRFSLKQALGILKKTFRLGISGRLEVFQSTFPIIIISAFLGSYALGIFSATFKFFTFIALIFNTIIMALAPYLVKLRLSPPEMQRKYVHLLMMVMLAIGILTSLFSYVGGEFILDLLFGKSFGAAVSLFKLMCLITMPLTPITFILNALLVYFDFDKKYLHATLSTGFTILVGTPLLVHFFSLNGAIWAISLSIFVNLIVAVYHTNKIIPNVFGFSFKRKEITMQHASEI